VSEEVSEWEKEPIHSLTHLLTHPSSRILVHGDEGRLRQVLINLLSNAVKFTESGEVILRISETRSLATSATHHSSLITFEIIDTGVGISPEEQPLIFAPFARGKSVTGERKEGVGLGLTIAKRLVEFMGGELSFESPPRPGLSIVDCRLMIEKISQSTIINHQSSIQGGKGSRFFFTLNLPPVLEATSQAAGLSQDGLKHIPTRLANGYKVKALVADDNKENRDVLSMMLSDIGVSVITAENGVQAVEATLANKPDIVFLDIWMPHKGGLEAVREILLKCSQGRSFASSGTPKVYGGEDRPKLVAVSASAMAYERQSYFDAGFDDFIAKPIDAKRVYECLAKFLRIEYEYEDENLPPIDGMFHFSAKISLHFL
jgi:CheY-like chemotaxis protein/anti-sigma regulatory factor (Ser/Thr protein kinase)